MTAFLFDVDNTLTPPRQKMDQSFLAFFLDWMRDRSVYLVSGSDEKKIFQQMPSSIITRCSGVFSSMGNKLSIDKELIYENKFDPPKTLIEMLSSFQINTKSPVLGEAPFFEYRTGMLNFTTVGRSIGLEQRNTYYEWDEKSKERTGIAKKVEETFPDLEAKVGGQISLDIQPKGNNKTLSSKWIRENKTKDIVFFGDKCFEGGNDHDVSVDVLENKGKVFEVGDWRNTFAILQNGDL